MKEQLIRIGGSESWDKDLPPIAFAFDRSGTALTIERFPSSDCYVRAERPPQGSVEFAVYGYKSEHHNVKVLREAVEKQFDDTEYQPLRFGRKLTLEIDGVDRNALILKTGKNIQQRDWVASLVPSPDGGPYGLLLLFGIYNNSRAVPNNPHAIITGDLKTIADSFRLGSD